MARDEAVIVGNPTVGDCQTEYTDAGRFRGQCTPEGFDRVEYEGTESPSQISWTYEIYSEGVLFAEGYAISWRTE